MTPDEAPTASELVAADDAALAELVVAPGGDLADDPIAAYLARLNTRQSRATILASLRVLAGVIQGKPRGEGGDYTRVPWHALRATHTATLRAALLERGYALATIDRHLAVLRGVLRSAMRCDLLPADAFVKASDLPRPRGTREVGGVEVTPDEVARLFRACAPDALGVRDRAMLVLFFAGGLRRDEVARLALDHYHAPTRTLHVWGKGQKVRTVPLGAAATDLAPWLALRGEAPGSLLLAFTPQRRPCARGLGPTGVYYAFCELGKRAGVPVHPHDARHTVITRLLDQGVDLFLASQFAGHARLDTTRRYDKRSERALQAAINNLPTPLVPHDPTPRG